MKKSLIAAGCIFLLAVTALPVCVYYINQGKESVVITQEVIEGDPRAASGIVLKMENTWNNNLFWETEYVIGSGSPAESKFTFSSRQRNDSPYGSVKERVRLRDALSCFYGPGYGASGLDPGAVPVPEAVREMVRQAGPREAVVTVMPVHDLYEYWPVSVEIASDSHTLFYVQEYGMPEFFQIPVPEDATAEITIQKDADNRCTRLQIDTKNDVINIISAGAFGTKGCYLAYCCVDAQSGNLMPPGEDYGIYYVPYHPDGTKMIRKVFSLEKDCMPIALEADEETGRLWVLILQGGRYHLDLLDPEEEGNCRLVQQITVTPPASGCSTTHESLRVYCEDAHKPAKEAGLAHSCLAKPQRDAVLTARFPRTNYRTFTVMETDMDTNTGTGETGFSPAHMTLVPGGVLLTWQQDGLFAFISKDSEDAYALWYVGHFPAGKGYDGNTLFPTEQAVLFDGERLTLAAFSDFTSNNIQLAVFTKEGLAYYGLYRHSGEWDRENNMPDGWIHPAGVIDSGEIRRTDNPLRLRFY